MGEKRWVDRRRRGREDDWSGEETIRCNDTM